MSLDFNIDETFPSKVDAREQDELISRLRSTTDIWGPKLFPNGLITNDRSELRMANIDGAAPRNHGSCSLAMEGEHAGDWYDHSTGDGGGPISAIQHATGLTGAALWDKARELANMPLRRSANTIVAKRTSDDTAREVVFTLAHCIAAGNSPATIYWSNRQLDAPQAAFGLDPDVLFHPSLTDYAEKRGRPGIVVRIRDPETGELTGGIHKTYLSDDCTAKADIEKPKMMLGPSSGVIMLYPMGEDGHIGVGEGAETCLAATKIFGIPTWAALSTSGMINFKFPSNFRALTIFADRGEGGETAAKKLFEKAQNAGIAVRIVRPLSDDDFNKDLMEGRTAQDYEKSNEAPKQELILPPPRSFEDAVTAAHALPRSPEIGQITNIMRGIVTAKFTSLQTDQVFAIIKNKCGQGYSNGKLHGYLKELKKEIHEVADGTPNWLADLQMMGETGEPKQNLHNTNIPLRKHSPLENIFALDEFTNGPCLLRRPPYDSGDCNFPRALVDTDKLKLTEYLQSLGLNTTPEMVAQGVRSIADENRFHPVREWLEELSWDGKPRLDTWLIGYAGVEDNEYIRAVSSRFLISAIARVYRPGIKVDTAMILEGPQGINKSKTLRLLFDGDERGWFTDEIADLGSKDSAMQLRGVWCVELAELDVMNRADVARLKAFLGRTNDRYRPPFSETVVDVPRQCVFAGTVNNSDYLRDETGARRFWPVACEKEIDAIGVFRVRLQLWAEALRRYKAGEKWYLHERRIIEMAAEEQSARMRSDAWDDLITLYLRNKYPPHQARSGFDEISLAEIMENALCLEKSRWGHSEQTRVGQYMAKNGWAKSRLGPGSDGVRPNVYRRLPQRVVQGIVKSVEM